MPGTILENLSGRKLSVLVSILLIFQVTCFLIGGLVAPSPAGSQDVIARVCVDKNPGQKDINKWFVPKTCEAVDLDKYETTRGLNESNLVLAFQMPLFNYDFSRWQQNLVGVLQIDMVQKKGFKLEPVIELTLDARLAYRNDPEPIDKWTYYAHSEEKRIMDCSVDEVDNERDGYPYTCSSVPLFELGSLHHDYYLLNLYLPVDNNKNARVGQISDIHLHIIYMNGGFTKVWLSLKTFFFPIIVAIIFWFWRRVYILTRTPALLEYMLLALGIALAILDIPLEFFTLNFDMPYMLLLSDIRQGIFYGMLLSFWLVFAGEHMLIQDTGERSSLKLYWKHLSAVIIGCFSLLIFDLCERGVQLRNPFYSIWVTPIGTNLALSFIILAGISASMYFVFLNYMIWMVFKNISIKRSILPSMSTARRLHYEGIIYRFNFLMLATIICAAATIISFILNQVAEGQNKWDESMDLDMSSALFTGVFGMWNVYICAMLILYAPSHKQWPVESVCGEGGEEVEFSRLPTDPSPSEISSLTSFASKANID